MKKKETRNDKMNIFEFLDYTKVRLTLKVALQYISVADLSELLWPDLASRFARALPIPYIQVAILKELLLHSVISFDKKIGMQHAK